MSMFLSTGNLLVSFSFFLLGPPAGNIFENVAAIIGATIVAETTVYLFHTTKEYKKSDLNSEISKDSGAVYVNAPEGAIT